MAVPALVRPVAVPFGAAGPSAPGMAPPPASAADLRRVLPILFAATFMQLLDSTIVNVAVPELRTDLAATSGQVQLVVAGYQLAFACVLLVGGRLGDHYGRRRLFLLGMLGFVVASAACALAPTAWGLVVARLLQGACSGLMFPQVLSILQVSVPPQRRPQVFGLYGATVGLSTVLGPVLGGLLLDPLSAGWRSVFWVNVPIGVVALALTLRHVPESRSERSRGFDLLSLPLAAGGLFLLLFPLVIGQDEGWPVWTFVGMAAAVPVLAVFALRQRQLDPRRMGQHASTAGPCPLVSPALFASPNFGLGLAMNVVFFAGVGPFFFVLIVALQEGLGWSALLAGVTTVPFALAGAVASRRSARLAELLGPRVLVLGCALLVLGHTAAIGTVWLGGTDLTAWAFAPALTVAGLGMGLFVAPVTHVVLAGVNRAEAGAASGVLATSQQVGGAAGVAVLGVLFFHLLGARTGPTAFVSALQNSLWWEVAVFTCAGLLALGIRRPSPAAPATGPAARS